MSSYRRGRQGNAHPEAEPSWRPGQGHSAGYQQDIPDARSHEAGSQAQSVRGNGAVPAVSTLLADGYGSEYQRNLDEVLSSLGLRHPDAASRLVPFGFNPRSRTEQIRMM
jgi:hypothetical protein